MGSQLNFLKYALTEHSAFKMVTLLPLWKGDSRGKTCRKESQLMILLSLFFPFSFLSFLLFFSPSFSYSFLLFSFLPVFPLFFLPSRKYLLSSHLVLDPVLGFEDTKMSKSFCSQRAYCPKGEANKLIHHYCVVKLMKKLKCHSSR